MWCNGSTVAKASVSSNLMTAAKISLFINHPSDLMDSAPLPKAIVSNSPSPPATMKKPRLLMSPVLTALLCSPGRTLMAVEVAAVDSVVDLGVLRDVTAAAAAALAVTTVVTLVTSLESVTGAIIPVEVEALLVPAVTIAVTLVTSLGIATGSIIPVVVEEVLVIPAALLVI